MISMTGAEVLIRLLERQGVEVISGIPGGSNLPMYDALSRSTKIRHVLARHEQGAGFIAQGMARMSGRPEVCWATSGPGATNILTAIADAKLDSIPVVCITGQVPSAMIGSDAFQEVDTYGMSIPITKHNYLARTGKELLTIVPDAFRVAASGRPGPVLIDIPKDVQAATIEFEEWPEPGCADPVPAADSVDIASAVELINAAKRPVFYLGGGVIHSGAAAPALALAEKAGIPCTMTLMALGVVPDGHPLNIGMLGMHAARYTNMLLEECDLLIAAGSRFDDRATGKVAQFCPDAKIIHFDIDEAELHKIKVAHVGVVGDVGKAIEALHDKVEPDERKEWNARVAEIRKSYPLEMPGGDDPCTPYGLIRKVAEIAGKDAIISTDVGQHQMWAAQAYPFSRPRQWLTSGGLGTMGFGLPAAMGAAIACPDNMVISFSGDGSILMNIQELVTAAEEELNVKVIVMNNNALGLVRQQQSLFYKDQLFASVFKGRVDFAMVAQGFGVKAYDLATSDDPAAMLTEALAQPGPVLINAPIDPNEMVYPMVPPGGANKDMIG